jgi:ubiquitin carboxyl-terminal hydrolase 22/27/51
MKDIGHNNKSCRMYRNLPPNKGKKQSDTATSSRKEDVCLACEMDSLFLEYYRRSTGSDVVSILNDLAESQLTAADTFLEISRRDEESYPKGEPIIIDKLLVAAWRSSGMNHIAGYDQHDAHEFLHAFLDILGRQICRHRARVDAAINMARCGNPFSKDVDQGHHGKASRVMQVSIFF